MLSTIDKEHGREFHKMSACLPIPICYRSQKKPSENEHGNIEERENLPKRGFMLQFDPLESAVDSSFWQVISKLKMDEWKLNDDFQQIIGTLKGGKWVMQNGTAFALPCRIFLSSDSLSRDTVGAPGVLKNCNTLEDFKSLDKNTFLKDCGRHVRFILQ